MSGIGNQREVLRNLVTPEPITAASTGTKNATGRTRGVQSGKTKNGHGLGAP
jgi:hypothetical protein